jgi:hypothetical protein
MPLLIVADKALTEAQVRVALAPAATIAGEAVNVTVGGGVATKPTQPVNAPAIRLKARDNHKRRVQACMSALGCRKGG